MKRRVRRLKRLMAFTEPGKAKRICVWCGAACSLGRVLSR